MFLNYTGQRRPKCPILVTTDELLEQVREINQKHQSGEWDVSKWKLVSLDFTQLYPSIPILDLKRVLRELIDFLFERQRVEMNKSRETKIKTLFICCPKYPQKGEAKWEIEKVEGGNEVYLLPDELADHIDKLLDNSYCSYGGGLWKIIQGFQTGDELRSMDGKLVLGILRIEICAQKVENLESD